MSRAEHAASPVPSRTAGFTDASVHRAPVRCVSRAVGRALSLLVPCVLGLSAARAADVTVAFVGDQGHRENAEHLMERVRDGGVDLLVLGGDLGYGDDAEPWLEMMERTLGEDFPVISAVGNHELYNWPQYRAWLAARIERVPELACDGDVGVKAHCRFRGLSIVQTAPGVHEVPGVDPDDDYAGYIRDEFADDPSAWRVCSFHKNQTAMQIGNKSDATGWGVYEACREAGAIVATAHEHSYSRTHLMGDFDALEIAHRDDHLVLEPGRSFAFVSGLGGHSPRGQARDGDWWASTYSLGDGASAGALVCTFSDRTADCRFEDIAGAVPDRFTLESRVGVASSGSSDDGAVAAEEESGDGESTVDGDASAVDADPSVAVSREEADVDGALPDDAATSEGGASAEVAEASGEGSPDAEDGTSEASAPAEEPAASDAAPVGAEAIGEDVVATGESSAARDLPATEEGVADDGAPVTTFGLMAAPPPAQESEAAPADGEASAPPPPADEPTVASDGPVPPRSGPTVAAPSPDPALSPETRDDPVVLLDADDVSSAAPPADGAERGATGGGGAAAAATIVALLSLGGLRRRARTRVARAGRHGMNPTVGPKR